MTIFWLAPLFPILAFLAIAVGVVRGRSAGVAISAIALSFGVTLSGLFAIPHGPMTLAWTWLTLGGRPISAALQLDALSTLVAVLVSLVSLVVFTYARGYMEHDGRKSRFFAILSLFAGSMLLLVISGDVITFFMAWELVGVCSYLLIAFWFEKSGAPAAATKALVVIRIGDAFLLAGLLLLVVQHNTTFIAGVATGGVALAPLLLFIGAASKSAQFPLHGWLPDAMAGPTPVSALLHSATMVAAGVFAIARFYPIFTSTSGLLDVMAWSGALTAIAAGAIALVQTDLKRTLAYSTMSQLGLMFVALGAGSVAAAVMLLVAQAFFKSTLFLAAGVVDHAVGGTTFERMGGLRRRLPKTFAAFVVAGAALAGLPVTLAWPAKDAVLAAALMHGRPLFVVAFLSSALTALYVGRMTRLVFLGESAGQVQGEQQNLVVPLLVMAVLVVIGGANAHLVTRFFNRPPDNLHLTLVAIVVAAGGIAAGIRWPRMFEPVAALLRGELGFQWLYAVLADATLTICAALAVFDRAVMDRIANGMTAGVLLMLRAASRFDVDVFTRLVSTLLPKASLRAIAALRMFDIRGIDETVITGSQRVVWGGDMLRRVQTGRIENYLMLIVGSVLALVALALIVR